MNSQNVNALDDETGKTPLAFAAKYDLDDIAEILLLHGANVNTPDKDLNTPLHYSAMGGKSITVPNLFKSIRRFTSLFFKLI